MEKQPRYRATNLEMTMAMQGRRGVWLADQIGVSRSYVSHVMKGRRVVDEEKAVKIAALLGVPFSLVFVLSDDAVCASDEGEAA